MTDVPEGYKMSEVGVIPEDWEVQELENVTTVIGDGIHSTPQYVPYSDIFFVNGNNLVDNSIKITDSTMCVSEHEYNKHKKRLNNRTILLSINGTIGNIAFFNDEKVILGKSAAYINVNNSTNKNFIFYLMQSSGIKNYFEDELTGSTIRNLSLKTIRNTPISLPPTKEEQQTIASALCDTDALITALGQLITKKRNIKQGAMQQLLTGEKRLQGFEGEWEVKTLGEVCQIFGRIGFRGYTKKDIVDKEKGAITISPSNIKKNKMDFSDCTYISWYKYEESPEIKIFIDDVLLVKTGSTYGKTAVVKKLKDKATINPQLVVLKKITINNDFLGYLMGFDIIQKQISFAIVGGAIPTLSQEQISNFKIYLPNLSEQTAIAQILSDMDAEIEALEQKHTKYKAIKQGMMQELLTGKTRLV